MEKQGNFPFSFYKPSQTLLSKPNKDYTKKETRDQSHI